MVFSSPKFELDCIELDSFTLYHANWAELKLVSLFVRKSTERYNDRDFGDFIAFCSRGLQLLSARLITNRIHSRLLFLLQTTRIISFKYLVSYNLEYQT
jgi:hypothetical protein